MGFRRQAGFSLLKLTLVSALWTVPLGAQSAPPDPPSMQEPTEEKIKGKQTYFDQALFLIMYGKLEEALPLLQEATRQHPEDVGAWSALALTSFKLGKEPESEAACRKALEIEPGDQDMQLLLGRLYTTSNRETLALPILDDYLKKNPNSAEAHFHRGVALDALNRKEEAILAYEEALHLDPVNTKVLCNLGVDYYFRGKNADAESLFKRAIKANPNSVLPQMNLGILYVKSGRINDAKKVQSRLQGLDANSARKLEKIINQAEERSGK
jgi:Flp pilus assembly protein TadD